MSSSDETKDTIASEGAEYILQQLETALSSDGDFPVRARAVMELRKLADDPNTPVESVVEVILGDPSLGTRILHLVNSVFYQRSSAITTVSQAVVQLGMRALTDLCTGLVLLQRFSPVAQRGGIFADAVKKTVIISLLTSAVARELGDEDEERGYLAGTFFSIGPLLLAYYFPQVFESAERRAIKHRKTITQSITETLGIPPVALSLGIIDSLSIPDYYRDLLLMAYSLYIEEDENDDAERCTSPLAQALAVAAQLADAMIDTKTRPELSQQIDKLASTTPLSREQLEQLLKPLPKSFQTQITVIEMNFLTLPEHVLTWIEHGDSAEAEAVVEDEDDEFSYYLDEIRQAIRNQETLSSIIASVMEALAFSLEFDRVLLMFSDPDDSALYGKMSLGESFETPAQSYVRTLDKDSERKSPESAAFLNGTVETFGDPLFDNGWPFVALPIGTEGRTVGVIYADAIESDGKANSALPEKTQAALTILTELLDQATTSSNGI